MPFRPSEQRADDPSHRALLTAPDTLSLIRSARAKELSSASNRRGKSFQFFESDREDAGAMRISPREGKDSWKIA